ncbi:MAG: hypothetical protein ACAH21_16485 [Ramlibacter sp.]|nr:hypothetical protein [Ramlibacter sp.]
MHKQFAISLPMAALLASVSAFYYFGIVLPGKERDSVSGRGIELALASQPSALEHCVGAARMIFDVHWAAACMAQADGHPECELPNDRAAVVNAWLRDAEQRCMAEAREGRAP